MSRSRSASTWASAPRSCISPVLVALLGILFERFLLRRFYTADPILSLLVTFGLAMVAEQAIRMIWGAAPLPSTMPPAFKGNVMLGDFLFSRYRLFLLAVVIVRDERASGCCCTRPRSAAWCAPACSGPTWWRCWASACSPT